MRGRRTALACEQPISSTPRGSFARSRIIRLRSGAPWTRYCAWWRHCRRPTRAQDWPPRTGGKSSPSSYRPTKKPSKKPTGFAGAKHEALWQSREQAEDTAERLRKFGQPLMLMILSLLLQGEKSVSEIDMATGIGQPGL